MKEIFNKVVPLWIAVLSLGLVTLISLMAFINLREVVYSYQFYLPATNDVATAYTYGSWPALAHADFYNKVLDQFIAQKTTFINVNLGTMQLQLYKEGVAVQQIPILTKGKPGSWWETPAGLYKVEGKTPVAYSRFANVYMQWALPFQGNFIIHGWPYYADGTPVSSKFSGGCIRLATEDAKMLYEQVNPGTPILVTSDNFQADGFHAETQGPPIAPKSFFAADLKSNSVFAEKNADEILPIASITKLMTALVAVEYENIETEIKITPEMLVPTSIPRLRVGQSLSLYNLLQPLLKESSNEAAVAISHFLGPQYFVKLMNQKAASIGMNNTHFTDTSGSDWGNVSTAHDLFVLAQYLYGNRSFILRMTTNNKDPNIYGPSTFTDLQNFNVFAENSDFIGGKVGLNGATSGTILSVFEEPFSIFLTPTSTTEGTTAAIDMSTTTVKDITARPIMFVILGSDDYAQDAKNLFAWIKNRYQ